MSDSSEAKRERRAREMAQGILNGLTPDQVLSFDQVKQIINAGLSLPAGTRITAPTSMSDLYAMDLGSGASPIESMGLQDYLNQNGLSLQQYVEQTQSQPFQWNADGTVIYDPAFQKVAYEYTDPSYDRNLKIGLGLMAALTGAGLSGLGQGAASAASGLSGLSQAELAALIESGTVGTAGAGLEAAAGIGAGSAAAGGSLLQNLAQAATGTGNLSQAELAALIESGTTGTAGAALESAAGLGTAGLGEIAATGLSNLTGIGGSAINGASGLLNGGAGTAASALSGLLGTGSGTTDLIGKLLGAGVGYLGSKEQTDALTNLQNQLSAQRAPFLNKAVGYLNNPESFYSSPEATGAANATMRALSASYGNPATSPTAQSLATGALYDRYSNTVNSLGSLGLSGQGIQANLGSQIASGVGQPYAIAGNLIGGMTTPSLNVDQLLSQAIAKQFGGNSYRLP